MYIGDFVSFYKSDAFVMSSAALAKPRHLEIAAGFLHSLVRLGRSK